VEHPTRAAAERACECVHLVANAENLNPQSPTMRGLIDRATWGKDLVRASTSQLAECKIIRLESRSTAPTGTSPS
jgi:hypothetical protein